MRLQLQTTLSDSALDAKVASSQRQLELSLSAIAGGVEDRAPLNLCLVLDRSGSMNGKPLETVKKAAYQLIDRLSPGDRISVVAFDHRAKVLVSNQLVEDPENIRKQIRQLGADGGTAIDEGLKLGITELAKGRKDTISQIFLLTDGENEHGDNQRCLKLAKLASEEKITLNTLGFGEHWNQDVLEQIADTGNGALSYIEHPEQAVEKFVELFNRVQAVGLTNAYLLFSLPPKVRLAELKPVAQVSPETIELPVQPEGNRFGVRLGDLMKDVPRIVLANLYISQLPEGQHTIATVQVRYDDPAQGFNNLMSPEIPIQITATPAYQPQLNPQVQQSILALAKYRQTQLAEAKLQQGDRAGAATLLQTAAKTALQMGDQNAATVLQTSATQLQAGQQLSEADRKKTRIVSKTILQE